MHSSSVNCIRWENNRLVLLDQRHLPVEETYISCETAAEVAEAIKSMVVRGAPAIGICAAYGMALDALRLHGQSTALLTAAQEMLAASRPTAVNLFWALERIRRLLSQASEIDANLLIAEAHTIHSQDLQANLAMGESGARLLAETGPGNVITHCNTGSLATGGHGTALGVIRTGYAQDLVRHVYADETRPWLQGSRLTAWELHQDNIPVSLIADGAAAHLMKTKNIRWAIVGADRITRNGDVANKIGTYSLAVNARFHGVKFMVVAPTSTIDFAMESGESIPIEERSADELKHYREYPLAPSGVDGFNPVFDVTPAALIDAIVTEKGIVKCPAEQGMAALENR